MAVKNSISQKPEQMLIVTGTGRCGTRAFALLFDGFHEYKMREEYRKRFIEPYKDRKPFKNITRRRKVVDWVYGDIGKYDVFVDSSNQASYWLDAIHEKFPQARFIVLVRNGRDVVRSAISREWHNYNEHEHLPPQGDPLLERWGNLSALEKNTWFWVEKNRQILDRLKGLPEEIYKTYRIEDCHKDDVLDEIEEFAGIPTVGRYFVKTKTCNSSQKHFPPPELWTLEVRKEFDDMAGKMMEFFGYE